MPFATWNGFPCAFSYSNGATERILRYTRHEAYIRRPWRNFISLNRPFASDRSWLFVHAPKLHSGTCAIFYVANALLRVHSLFLFLTIAYARSVYELEILYSRKSKDVFTGRSGYRIATFDETKRRLDKETNFINEIRNRANRRKEQNCSLNDIVRWFFF